MSLRTDPLPKHRAVRPANNQSVHDIAVHLIATEYVQAGYQVRADVRGYDRPYPINGWIPDVVATRLRYTHGNTPVIEKVIVEVETEESVRTSHALAQAAAFRRAEADEPHTSFILRMA